MWDLLKSKISNFISKITGEEEGKKKEEAALRGQEPGKDTQPSKEELVEREELKTDIAQAIAPAEKPEIKKEDDIEVEHLQEQISHVEEKKEIPKPHIPLSPDEQRGEVTSSVPTAPVNKDITIGRLEGQKTPATPDVESKTSVSATPSSQSAGIEIKVGLADKLKKAVLGKIKLSREKIEEITDELEFSLIQADVHPDVAVEVCSKIKERMADKEFSRGDLENEIREILREVFEKEAFGDNKVFDLIEKVRQGKKPYKILFVGPNGAGKTTTIAKVARMLLDAGFTVVISASDTFRAAAIEQTEEHGKRLGVRVIRQNYGADAAAVAFDAIKHAEANNIDVVLIDSAGRQDTNFNLLKELQKINRISTPDLRIFVGESIAGNSLYQQVGKFKEMIGLDGVILTKADCDAKGGTAISILRETGVPIIYLGMGQSYTDLKKFDPSYIINNIV
ncbi:MAG: signal recognition particle-docking protein FtsY [Candidatus Micrarchaeia archaeon]